MQVKINKHRIPLPRQRWLRILIGVLLILGGFVSFLPFLGIWMLPLGILFLSLDVPFLKPVWQWMGKKMQRWFGLKMTVEEEEGKKKR